MPSGVTTGYSVPRSSLKSKALLFDALEALLICRRKEWCDAVLQQAAG